MYSFICNRCKKEIYVRYAPGMNGNQCSYTGNYAPWQPTGNYANIEAPHIDQVLIKERLVKACGGVELAPVHDEYRRKKYQICLECWPVVEEAILKTFFLGFD